MKITLSSSGGIAAAMRRRDRTVDTATLEPSEAARVHRLAAGVVAGGSAPPNPRLRDGRTHELVIDDEGKPPVAIEQQDGSLTSEFAELMQLVKDRG